MDKSYSNSNNKKLDDYKNITQIVYLSTALELLFTCKDKKTMQLDLKEYKKINDIVKFIKEDTDLEDREDKSEINKYQEFDIKYLDVLIDRIKKQSSINRYFCEKETQDENMLKRWTYEECGITPATIEILRKNNKTIRIEYWAKYDFDEE